jgi:hypothetical protein
LKNLKMKRNCLFLLLVIPIGISLVYLQSCKHDTVSKDESIAYVKDDQYVSINEAKIIAENLNYSDAFKDSIGKRSLKSTSKFDKRVLKDSLAISDKNDKTCSYFYVFNYKSGGFSIISADKRNSPVIAYSDSGNFSSNLETLPFGLQQWMDRIAFIIKEKRHNKLKPSAIISHQWVSLLNPSIQKLSKITMLKNAPITPPQNSYIYTVGPLLKTKWSQGCGYNNYCPTLNNVNSCNYAYTGCVTTAIAQVMAYWKYPTSYNWNAMSTYSSDATARLMGDIFPNVISSFDSNGSSCTNDFKIVSTLLSRFHYSSASLAGYVNLISYNGGFNDKKNNTKF